MKRYILFSLVLVIVIAASVQAIPDPGDPAEVAVYYFHGSQRCMTCLKLEELTVLAIRTEFQDLLDQGILRLEVIDYHEEGNEHFEKDFDLQNQAVILVSFQESQIGRWKNLEKIWDLVDEAEKVENYIVEETQAFLDSPSDKTS